MPTQIFGLPFKLVFDEGRKLGQGEALKHVTIGRNQEVIPFVVLLLRDNGALFHNRTSMRLARVY